MRVARACSASALLLSGCQTFSPDGGMDAVSGIVGRELNKDVAALRTPQEVHAARARVAQLLRRRLTPTRRCRSRSSTIAACRRPTTSSASRKPRWCRRACRRIRRSRASRLSGAVEIEIERRIVANILALATLPARAEIAADRFRQAQLRAAEETLRIAAETRRAYYRAVAARELGGFLTQAKSAAEAATELAKRLGETGAMNKLDQAREQVFYAETTAQLATRASARQRARAPRAADGAVGRRPRFQAAGCAAGPAAAAAGLAGDRGRGAAAPGRSADRAHRARGAGQVLRAHAGDALHQPSRRGRAVSNDARRASRRQECATAASRSSCKFRCSISARCACGRRPRPIMQAVNRLTEKAVNVRSEARDAYRGYRSTYDIAAPLPARGAAAAQDHLRRNAAALQRHADRRVSLLDRGAPAHRRNHRRDRGRAQFLARRATDLEPR